MPQKAYLLFINLHRVQAIAYETLVAAKNQGFAVILVARVLPNYAKKHIAYFQSADLTNLTEILSVVAQLAKRFAIHGLPVWTESEVILAAHLCALLKLPGLSLTAAQLSRNKFLMKSALQGMPELLPKFTLIKNKTDLTESIAYPAILKPVSGAGSKGIFKVHNMMEAEIAFEQLQIITQPSVSTLFNEAAGECLLEEFLEGPEYSVEGIVQNSSIDIIGITDKWTTKNFYLEYQHLFPSQLTTYDQQLIIEKSQQIIKALGINHCAFHLEAKLTSKGFRFIEIAARAGGDFITSHLIPLSCGLSFYEAIIRCCLGKEIAWQPVNKTYSGVRFLLADRAGKFNGVAQFSQLKKHAAISHTFLLAKKNACIQLPPLSFGTQRVAAIIAKTNDYQHCQAALEQAAAACSVLIH